MVIIIVDEFDFYNLSFHDRTTYRHYKEYLACIQSRSSTHTKGFTVGVDDYCLDRLEQQFKREGYYTSNTKNSPLRVYNRETDKEEQQVYLTVGTSKTIGKY